MRRSIRDTRDALYEYYYGGIFMFSKSPNRFGAPLSLLFNSNLSSFPNAERPELEVDYSPTSKTKVKNKWTCTSAPVMCLHVMGRDNFPFYCCVGHCTFSVVYFSYNLTLRKKVFCCCS